MSITPRRYLSFVLFAAMGLFLIGSVPTGKGLQQQSGGSGDTLKVEPGTTTFLEPNAPNPFAESTVIAYTLDRDATVTVAIYDAFFNLVKVLVDEEERTEGRHPIEFRPNGEFASGIYFYTLEIEGSDRLTRRMMLRR